MEPDLKKRLAAIGVTVPEADDLTQRLRGVYPVGPPENPTEFGTRKFFTPPIQFDAADRIDALESLALRLALRLAEAERCRTCGGSGKEHVMRGEIEWETCEDCHGTGHRPPSAGSET